MDALEGRKGEMMEGGEELESVGSLVPWLACIEFETIVT